MKVPFVICADLECLSATKINKHTPSGYSLFTRSSFDNTQNMLNYYRGQDCIEMLCKDLKKRCRKNNVLEKKRDDTFNRRGK